MRTFSNQPQKSQAEVRFLKYVPDPFYPATIENLLKIGVTFPIVSKTLAIVYLVTS
jgi:hypothetical protein